MQNFVHIRPRYSSCCALNLDLIHLGISKIFGKNVKGGKCLPQRGRWSGGPRLPGSSTHFWIQSCCVYCIFWSCIAEVGMLHAKPMTHMNNSLLLICCRVNLRPAGGGVVENPPSGFFQIVHLSYIFSAHVVKISDPGHARSGHQVTSSDLTS